MSFLYRSWRAWAGAATLGLAVALPSAALAKPQAGPCAKLVTRLPGTTQAACESSQLKNTGASSRRGFPILSRRFEPAMALQGKRVLFIGGIHGDEMSASAAVFHWMRWMPENEAKQIVWNVVPVLNPDGLLAPSPKRVNANGVDLNRNFPTPDWAKEAPQYWIRKTGKDPRRFPGKAPLSEPESRWISEEIKRFQPQLIISVHAPFGVLDLDGPVSPPQRFGRLLFNRVGVYPGSLGHYGGLNLNVPILTIELPNAKQKPSDEEMRRIWRDMLDWIKHNIPEDKVSKVAQLGG